MTAKNRERGLDVEETAADRFPIELAAEDRDDRNGWHDGHLEINYSGWPAGAPVEVKSCYPDYRDRAGRWWIPKPNHERLLGEGGVYALAVVERETERVLRLALIDSSTIDAIIDGDWWDAGRGGRQQDAYRQIPWTRVLETINGG